MRLTADVILVSECKHRRGLWGRQQWCRARVYVCVCVVVLMFVIESTPTAKVLLLPNDFDLASGSSGDRCWSVVVGGVLAKWYVF